ncbi:hypothetical protein BDQ17DRAFT_1352191 [Cyathus striatus]|nr:hypothetical protein BDQ17DRAFT_1352191 [Cyathus striatus]
MPKYLFPEARSLEVARLLYVLVLWSSVTARAWDANSQPSPARVGSSLFRAHSHMPKIDLADVTRSELRRESFRRK